MTMHEYEHAGYQETFTSNRFLALAISFPFVDKITRHPEGGDTLIWTEYIHQGPALSPLRHEETGLQQGRAYTLLFGIIQRNAEIRRITNINYAGPRRIWHHRGINT